MDMAVLFAAFNDKKMKFISEIGRTEATEKYVVLDVRSACLQRLKFIFHK